MLYNVLTGLLIVACLVLIGSVIMQSGKSAGLSGSIGGGAEQLMGKKKGRAIDHTLDTITKVAAIAFILITLVLVYLQ